MTKHVLKLQFFIKSATLSVIYIGYLRIRSPIYWSRLYIDKTVSIVRIHVSIVGLFFIICMDINAIHLPFSHKNDEHYTIHTKTFER